MRESSVHLTLEANSAGRGPLLPCHLRAIPDGRSRFLTVNHGQSGHLHLHRFSMGEVRHEW